MVEGSDTTGHEVEMLGTPSGMPAVPEANRVPLRLLNKGCLNEAGTLPGVRKDSRPWDSGGVAPLHRRGLAWIPPGLAGIASLGPGIRMLRPQHQGSDPESAGFHPAASIDPLETMMNPKNKRPIRRTDRAGVERNWISPSQPCGSCDARGRRRGVRPRRSQPILRARERRRRR